MSVLTVEGYKSVFENLLPIIEPYSHYLYWKYPQYELMLYVARLVKAKAHSTFYGFSVILDLIYSYPNVRKQSKEHWLNIIQLWFKNQASENKSGENNIQALYGRGLLKGKIVA